MFGFNVLTWNAEYQGGTYSKTIKRSLFGGTPGHSSTELIIPASEENKKLIEEVNKNNKLLVQESTTLISRPIEKEPFYEAVEVPCYKVYFSFWGDVRTKKTLEQHRMNELTKDRLEEGQGAPRVYTEKGKQILGNGEIEWKGLIGSIKGSPAIEYIQHPGGPSSEVETSTEKMSLLKSVEHEKELLLWNVKDLSRDLQKLKTKEEKDTYITSERVQEILAEHEVSSIEELQLKLSGMSAAINNLRQELQILGVQFGASPDAITHFSIDPDNQQEYALDYREILKEMGRIANGIVPYHALKMNCCTTTMKIINAGISSELREKLQASGYAPPSSNLLFETSQSVFDFSLKLSSTLIYANSLTKESDSGALANFLTMLYQAYMDIISIVFKPTKKQQLFNQREEYVEYLLNTRESLKQLEGEFSSGTIDQATYGQLKINAQNLIDIYKNKVIETEYSLLSAGYIQKTSDYDAQIKEFLGALPYAQFEAITKLESDKQIIEAIDKITSHIYSNMQFQEIYGELFLKDIRRIVVNHVEKIVNENRIPLENFDYTSIKQTENSEKIAIEMQQLSGRDIFPKNTVVDKEVANLFLDSYEKNFKTLKKKAQIYEIKLQKQNDPSNKATRMLQSVLAETQGQMKLQLETIDKIKNADTEKVEIIFPPVSKIKDMTVEQIKSFVLLIESKPNRYLVAGDVGSEIYKNIKILNRLQVKLFEGINNINPELYNFDSIERLRVTINTCPFLKKTSEFVLEKLAQNLVEVINQQSFKLPLSTTAQNIIVSYLNFNKYIEANGNKISNFSKLNEILLIKDPKYLKEILRDHDKVNLLSQRNIKKNQPSLISQYLTRNDHRFIYLFNKIVISQDEASHQEKFELSKMIEENLGNMNLNKRMGLFVKSKHPLAEKYQFAISDVKYLMFKTKLNKLNDVLLQKSEKAYGQLEKGEALGLKNQLTLFELGRLDDLAKLKPILDNLESLGLIKISSKLNKLHAQATHAFDLIEKIEQKVSGEHVFLSGDLVMNHSKKSLSLKNKSADSEVALTHTFVSQYGHAAQVYIDPETNDPTFSHIWGEHQTDRVKVVDIAISDVFRVDVTKLMLPEIQDKLEKYYKEKGLDYKKELTKLYQESTQGLLEESKERFKGIKNDKDARFQAGWANLGLYGGHQYKIPVDRESLHAGMFGEDGYQIKNKMICSEFVANSVVASIFETNKLLQEQLVEAGIIEDSEQVLRMPMEKEKLARVHPERLINLLKKEGCLIEVTQSSFLKKLVNQEQPYNKVDLKKIKSPGVIFSEELFYLSKKEPNKETFIIQAIEACKVYAKQEHLDIEFDTPQINSFLHKNFYFVHEKIHDNPNCIVRFFKNLIGLLEDKKEIKEKLEITLSELEKVQSESIIEKYQLKPSKLTHSIFSKRTVEKTLSSEQAELGESVKIQPPIS